LGQKEWKYDVLCEVDSISKFQSIAEFQARTVIIQSKYEVKEISSLMELALWKEQLNGST
jgi:predicted AlkP superfamily phosphohydrolase/phosphomutase